MKGNSYGNKGKKHVVFIISDLFKRIVAGLFSPIRGVSGARTASPREIHAEVQIEEKDLPEYGASSRAHIPPVFRSLGCSRALQTRAALIILSSCRRLPDRGARNAPPQLLFFEKNRDAA